MFLAARKYQSWKQQSVLVLVVHPFSTGRRQCMSYHLFREQIKFPDQYLLCKRHSISTTILQNPEWHAARLASLNTTHTVTWEEFKKKQKEDEMRKGELEADKDRMMREYRAQLDAERARKLAHGRNHSGSKSIHKKDRKDRDSKKRSGKKRKHSRRRSDDSSSSSSSLDSSSSEDERESKRSKSRSRKTKKEKKRKSKTKHSRIDDEEAAGPVPLSKFFGSLKN